MLNSRFLDQFYTKPEIAAKCIAFLKEKYNLKNFFLLEPSAGMGAFSNHFHLNSRALDIDPKKENIERADFLKIDLEWFKGRSVMTIGNPPFGKNASLAIKFFNRSAEISEIIAFIVPKTFKKVSVINKLDLNFHLEEEYEIPENSFIFGGEEYSVPCVFQIWRKSSSKREKIEIRKKTDYFEFTNRHQADFAIRRVGGLAGKVIEDYSKLKDPSHYFIKSNMGKTDLKRILRSLYNDLNAIAKNSAGNPSLSKHELISVFEKAVMHDKTKEIQGHGFNFETQVKKRISEIIQGVDIPYTEKWDIPPVSVKSFKMDPKRKIGKIFFGSAESIFENKDAFILVLIGYEQIGVQKVVIFSDAVLVTKKALSLLKGELSLDEIKNIGRKLKTFKKGEHKEARVWSELKRAEINKKSVFQINFKIDSKAQRRIQCSLYLDELYSALRKKIILENKLGIKSIFSKKREFFKKEEEKEPKKVRKTLFDFMD